MPAGQIKSILSQQNYDYDDRSLNANSIRGGRNGGGEGTIRQEQKDGSTMRQRCLQTSFSDEGTVNNSTHTPILKRPNSIKSPDLPRFPVTSSVSAGLPASFEFKSGVDKQAGIRESRPLFLSLSTAGPSDIKPGVWKELQMTCLQGPSE